MKIVIAIALLLIVLRILNINFGKVKPKVSKKFTNLSKISWKINFFDSRPQLKKVVLAPVHILLWLSSLIYLLFIQIVKANLRFRKN
jgi:hypothetical protein